MFKQSSKLLNLVYLLCGAWMAGTLAWRFFAVPESVAYLYNSDAAYLPYLYADLFERGGRLKDWYLTPAPYYFPDWGVFFLIRSLAGSSHLSVFGFALFQGWSLLGLLRYLGCRYRSSVAALSAAALGATALVSLPVDANSPFVYVHVSAHHFSTWLLGVLALDTLFRWRSGDHISNRDLAIFVTLLAMLVASDGIVAVWVLLPALLWLTGAAFLPWLLGSWRKPVEGRLTVALLAAWLLGSLAYRLVTAHPKKYGPKIGVRQVGENLDALWGLMTAVSAIPAAWPMLLMLAWWLGGAVVACIVAIKSRNQVPPAFSIVLLPLFAVLLSAALLSNIGVALRYLCPLYFGSLLLIVLNPISGKVLTLVSSIISCGVIVASIQALPKVHGAGAQDSYYPSDVACFDNALYSMGARRGLAQYWDAKRLSVLSRRGDVEIAQATNDLHFYEWITTSRLKHDAYDFAVISIKAEPLYTLNAQAIVAQSGAPSRIVNCGSTMLYLYPQNGLMAPWSEVRAR